MFANARSNGCAMLNAARTEYVADRAGAARATQAGTKLGAFNLQLNFNEN